MTGWGVLTLSAGLQTPTSGMIVNDLPPKERDTAIIIQNRALDWHVAI
jgi:ABC-type sugar transport system ATPase subunit